MKTVSPGTIDIIKRRARMDNLDLLFEANSAIALLNGNVTELIYASDVAQKAAPVQVFEINGNCPQHFTCLCVLGDPASVDEAVKAIIKKLEAELEL